MKPVLQRAAPPLLKNDHKRRLAVPMHPLLPGPSSAYPSSVTNSFRAGFSEIPGIQVPMENWNNIPGNLFELSMGD